MYAPLEIVDGGEGFVGEEGGACAVLESLHAVFHLEGVVAFGGCPFHGDVGVVRGCGDACGGAAPVGTG